MDRVEDVILVLQILSPMFGILFVCGEFHTAKLRLNEQTSLVGVQGYVDSDRKLNTSGTIDLFVQLFLKSSKANLVVLIRLNKGGKLHS